MERMDDANSGAPTTRTAMEIEAGHVVGAESVVQARNAQTDPRSQMGPTGMLKAPIIGPRSRATNIVQATATSGPAKDEAMYRTGKDALFVARPRERTRINRERRSGVVNIRKANVSPAPNHWFTARDRNTAASMRVIEISNARLVWMSVCFKVRKCDEDTGPCLPWDA